MLGLEETMALSKAEKQALGTQGAGWLQTLCACLIAYHSHHGGRCSMKHQVPL